MLLIQKISNLLNGVSQSPQAQRLPTQADEQVNALSSIAHGVRKRPPSKHLAKLTSTITGLDTAFVHTVNRDEDERYHLIVANGALKAYDAVAGTEITVQAPNGSGYLSDSDGKGFRAVTVGDTTVLVNRNIETKRGPTKAPVRVFEALIHVAQADFSTLYSVTLDGFTASFLTTDANDPSDRQNISTTQVAASLLAALEAEPTLTSAFNFTQVGSAIHVIRENFGDFTLTSVDGLSDEGLKIIKGSVQSFEELPPRAPDGFTVEIVGSPDSEFDNYFVRYDDLGGTEQNGVWRECPEPGSLTSFDASTMPHRIVRKGAIGVDNLAHEGLPTVIGAIAQSGYQSSATEASWTHYADGTALPGGSLPTIDTHNAGYKYTLSADAPSGAWVFYGINYASLPPGTTAFVRLYKNGTTQVAEQRFPYNPSDPFDVPDFAFAGEIPTGQQGFYLICSSALVSTDTLTLKLEYSTGSTPSVGSRAIMSGISDDNEILLFPGFQVFVNLLPSLTRNIYPEGSVITLSLGADNFQHTVTGGDEDSYDVAWALSQLVDADADYVLSGVGTSTTTRSFHVRLTTGATFTASISATFGSGLKYHNSELAMTANAHVNRIIRNLSDGSSGTITANTATTVTVTSLTGGVDNIFQRGDICLIEGAVSDQYFVFEQIPWDERVAGSLEVVPFPSFIDKPISEVFFYQNRLGFLSNENMVLSSSGDLFNLFRYTATDLRADDVIDVKSSHAEVTLFDSAILWSGGLYIKSDNAWFRVSGDPVLTPTTIRLDPVGLFPSSRDPRPVISAGRVFFTRAKSGKTQVFEGDLTVREDDSSVMDARDITKDIPTYIEGAPVALVGDAAEGFLALLTDANSQRFLYIYSFHYNERREKVFSSWSRWEFPAGTRLLALGMADGVLGIVRKHSDGAFIEQIDLDLTPAADEVSSYLDRRVTSGLAPSHLAGTTTWTLPYSVATDGSEGTVAVVNRTTGARYTVTRPTATTVAVSGQGDLTAASVYVGVKFNFLYRLSRLFVRLRDALAETSGRTRVNLIDLLFSDTSDLTVTVEPLGRSSKVFTLSKSSPDEGTMRVPVMCRNQDVTITLSNDTPGPCAISEIEWEAFFTARGRRI
jgi:hypothetical protein